VFSFDVDENARAVLRRSSVEIGATHVPVSAGTARAECRSLQGRRVQT
jgi:hypothetical protein